MNINCSFFWAKLLNLVHTAALRNCTIHKTASVGGGSNCIGISVGRYSYIGRNCSAENSTIGSFCSIASYCCIGGGNHPTHFFSSSPIFYEGRNAFRKHFSNNKFEEAKPVVIGNDVWIGEKVFIKDGIKIGNGAVVGAQSIVTHDIPPYAIVGGVPARIIRFRFSKDIIELLEKSCWWDMEEKYLVDFARRLEGKDITAENILQALNSK